MGAQRRRGALISALACSALLIAFNGEVGTAEASGAGDAESEAETASAGGPFVLDLANRSLSFPVSSDLAEAAGAKFVEVAFAELDNPDRIRLIFELRYRPEAGDQVFLGSFGPFPPDNPGTYIVPTRGLMRPGGAILLSMVVLDDVDADQELNVVLREPVLRRE